MTSYTRQSTFVPGDVVRAEHGNDEFNQIEAAMAQATGHTHSGTAAEGAYVPLISDTDNTDKVEIIAGGARTTGNHDVTGNITVTGTVDGRDIAADGTSLDGVIAGSILTASDIINTPAGTIDAIEVQAAINELDTEKAALAGATFTGNVTVPNLVTTGDVDGRDVSVDGTKLDGIESGATVDQSAAEIKAAYITQGSTWQDADRTKLDGIATSATADQTGAEIKTAYELEANTNAFTDTLLSKLNAIEASATADQTATDIRGLGFFDITNDGSGSGLDADLLDGVEGSDYARLSAANTYTQNQTIIGVSPSILLKETDVSDEDALINLNNGDFTIHQRSDAGAFIAQRLILEMGTGNLGVTGTIDGRDVSADGTKLDGIESSAKDDQTAAEIKTSYITQPSTWQDVDRIKLDGIQEGATVGTSATAADIRGLGFFDITNDGTGSGFDADLLDGQHASAFQAADADLTALAGLAKTDSNFIVGNGSTWVAETGSTARTSLGLGSLATASNVDNSDWSGTDLAVANGGTGSSTAAGARTNLGLGAMALEDTIDDANWSGTDLAIDNGGTGSSTAAGARTNLGLGVMATADNIQGGNWQTGGTDLAIADGGTGSSTAALARNALGLAIGTNVQAFDTDLTTLAGLAKTDSNFIVGNGSAWVAESGATARTSLGLGDLATASTISNSDWSGTDLALVNGGTGSGTASGARANLGLGTSATLDVGTSANKVVQLNGSSQLPAVDGSLLTGIASILSVDFVSSEQTITSAGSLTLPHSLGAAPVLIQCYLKCTTAEHGYSIGDEVLLNVGRHDTNQGISVVGDSTNVNIRYGLSPTRCMMFIGKDDGRDEDVTNSNWNLIVKAWV